MAIFSDKIVDVVYANPEYTLIKIRYEDDDGNVCPHVIDVDPNHSDFQALEAEGWDSEKINESTAEWKRAQSQAWNIEVNTAAKEIAMQMVGSDALLKEKERLEKETGKLAVKLEEANVDYSDAKRKVGNTADAIVYEYMLEFNEDADSLFKVKLWALETEIVKNADKATKSSIRKAKRITQLISIIDNIIE